MRKIVVDTDPGIDDALALLYLESRDDIEISAITVTPGNGTQRECLMNVNRLKELSGINAPVYRGAEKPLNRELETSNSHGEKGFGNLSSGNDTTSEGNAANALTNNAGNQTELLCLGPLTNVAKAIEKSPEMLKKYRSTTIMGGAISTFGNINRVAEFNFWVDPKAADKVITSKGGKLIVPVNVCRKVVIERNEMFNSIIKGWMEKLVKPYIEYYENETRFSGPVMYDPLAAGIALSKFGKSKEMNLRIESKGEFTRGMAVPELRPQKNRTSNCSVQTKVKNQRFQNEFLTSLKNW